MVENSIAVVLGKASDVKGNDDLEGAISTSKALLERFREKTNQDIQELQELAEWDTFTIAFYGETNAGKSTLIEAIRILLGDSEKLVTQQKFKELAKELRIDPHSLAAVDESIHQLEFRLSESQRDAESLKEKRQGFEVQQSVQLEAIKATIEQKRQSLSAWQRFVFFFKKLDEEKKLAEQKKKLDQLRVRNKADLDAIAAETLKMNQELNVLRSERA